MIAELIVMALLTSAGALAIHRARRRAEEPFWNPIHDIESYPGISADCLRQYTGGWDRTIQERQLSFGTTLHEIVELALRFEKLHEDN